MMMDYILNEQSLTFTSLSDRDVIDTLNEFVELTRLAKEVGFSRLRIPADFDSNLLNWSFSENDSFGRFAHLLETESRQYIKSISTASPFLPTEHSTYGQTWRDDWFYPSFSETIACKGLGAAAVLETCAISFLCDPIWDHNKLEMRRQFLSKSEQIENELDTIFHVASRAHFQTNLNEFQSWINRGITDGQTLWSQRDTLFPHLILCGKVNEQLQKLGTSKRINQIREKLTILNQFASKWQNGAFNLDALNQCAIVASPESPSTLSKFGAFREFYLPSGKRELFSLHIKTGDLRIHFLPDDQNNKIYVGYIGPHLRTVTN